MRILLVSPMLPEIGGVSISSERLKARLISDGHDVRVWSLGFSKPALNNRWLKLLKFLLFPLWVMIQPRFDIIHGNVAGVFRKRYLAAFKPLYRDAKLIMSIHGDAANLLNKPLENAFGKTDLLICVQQGDAEKIEGHFGIHAVDIPAFIMPAQVSSDDIPMHVLDFAKKDPATPLLIAAGGVVLTKEFYDLYGLKDTVELYQALRKSGQKVRLLLVVIGKVLNAAQLSYVESLSQQIADDSEVMIVQGTDMPLIPLFDYAQLFIRPTKTDGDALSVREALAMGCKVLASDVSIRPNGTVIYHDKNEMLDLAKRLLSNEMSPACQEGDFYHDILKAYETVLA